MSQSDQYFATPDRGGVSQNNQQRSYDDSYDGQDDQGYTDTGNSILGGETGMNLADELMQLQNADCGMGMGLMGGENDDAGLAFDDVE